MDRSYGRSWILAGFRVPGLGFVGAGPRLAWCGQPAAGGERCSGFCGSDPLIAMRTLIGYLRVFNARVRDQWIAPTVGAGFWRGRRLVRISPDRVWTSCRLTTVVGSSRKNRRLAQCARSRAGLFRALWICMVRRRCPALCDNARAVASPVMARREACGPADSLSRPCFLRPGACAPGSIPAPTFSLRALAPGFPEPISPA